MLEYVKENLDRSGLVEASGTYPGVDPEVEAMLFPTQLLCPAHTHSYVINNPEMTQVSVEMFGDYAPFIRSLQLSNNAVEALPQGLFRNFPNLSDLLMSKNKLKCIPSDISCCKKLKYLRCVFYNVIVMIKV